MNVERGAKIFYNKKDPWICEKQKQKQKTTKNKNK